MSHSSWRYLLRFESRGCIRVCSQEFPQQKNKLTLLLSFNGTSIGRHKKSHSIPKKTYLRPTIGLNQSFMAGTIETELSKSTNTWIKISEGHRKSATHLLILWQTRPSLRSSSKYFERHDHRGSWWRGTEGKWRFSVRPCHDDGHLVSWTYILPRGTHGLCSINAGGTSNVPRSASTVPSCFGSQALRGHSSAESQIWAVKPALAIDLWPGFIVIVSCRKN